MGEYLESLRGRVLERECDHLGHMNIQFYLGRVSDAAWAVLAAIGMTPEYIRDRRRGFAAVHQELDYFRELNSGDLIHMRSGVVDIAERKLTFLHHLHNSETGELAFTARVLGVNLDLDARKAVPLAPEIAARAKEYLIDAEDTAGDRDANTGGERA
jgi:acyl-CoA thioester hydrolase